METTYASRTSGITRPITALGRMPFHAIEPSGRLSRACRIRVTVMKVVEKKKTTTEWRVSEKASTWVQV